MAWEGVLETVLYHVDRGNWREGLAIRQRPVFRLIPKVLIIDS